MSTHSESGSRPSSREQKNKIGMALLLSAALAATARAESLVPARGLLPSGALEVAALAGTWPTNNPKPPAGSAGAGGDVRWGAHRATVLIADAAGGSTGAPLVIELLWRRRDVRPDTKDVRVAFRGRSETNTQPTEVTNRIVLQFNATSCQLLVDAASPGCKMRPLVLPQRRRLVASAIVFCAVARSLESVAARHAPPLSHANVLCVCVRPRVLRSRL